MPEWEKVPLGEAIRLRKEFITIDDLTTYKRCRVQVRAQGIVLRDEVAGSAIKTKKQQVCRAGEFLVAEIDAKMGGFGIVPPELEGAVVSSHYFLFEIDEAKLDRDFLDLYSKTPEFMEQVSAQGSTNYAAIRPSHVLGYTMPLPPLPEQQRIVARVKGLLDKVKEARRLREEVQQQVVLLSNTSKLGNFWVGEGEPLGNAIEVIDPNPSHRYPDYVEEGIPIISTINFVGEDGIDSATAKKVPEYFFDDTLGRFGVSNQDIIFSRKGKIGYARRYPSDGKIAMTHTLCLIKPDTKRLDSEYMMHLLRSSEFIDYLYSTMNNNVGVPTLGLGVIRNAPVTLPDLETQRKQVKVLNSLREKVGTVLEHQRQTSTELQALPSAILAQAFVGAL